MSLYTYLDSKDDLFDLMADAVAGEFPAPEPLPDDWREAISRIARTIRELITRRPWIVPLRADGPRWSGPNGLRHVEQSLRALAPLALPPQRQGQVVTAIDGYVLGYVTRRSIASHAAALDHACYRA